MKGAHLKNTLPQSALLLLNHILPTLMIAIQRGGLWISKIIWYKLCWSLACGRYKAIDISLFLREWLVVLFFCRMQNFVKIVTPSLPIQLLSIWRLCPCSVHSLKRLSDSHSTHLVFMSSALGYDNIADVPFGKDQIQKHHLALVTQERVLAILFVLFPNSS